MISRTRRINYWRSCEISEKLMETYLRAFRYNPHTLEVYFNRFNGKCQLVLTVNLYYTKDLNNTKIVKWYTRDYDSLTDLMCSNICFDL